MIQASQKSRKATHKRRVSMKQLTALLSTIILTFTLCISLAHAEALFIKPVLIKPALMLTGINNAVYSYNKNSAGLFYMNSLPKLAPITLDINSDTFGFAQENVINERNYFFEFSIMFNDKLQQLIAFFTHDDHDSDAQANVNNSSFSAKCAESNK